MKKSYKNIQRFATSSALALPLLLSAPAFAADDGLSAEPADDVLPQPHMQTVSQHKMQAGSPDLRAGDFVLPAKQAAQTSAAALSGGSAAGGSAALSMGPVSFAAPWVLMGLLSLPLLWFLMRSIPPKPLREKFPAIHLLFNMESKDQEPAKMPLWQRLLRLSAAAAIVTGMAQPEWDQNTALAGKGPLMLVIDNGWAAALHWDDRVSRMNEVIDRAEQEGRSVILLSTAPEAGEDFESRISITQPLMPAEARRAVSELEARPWPVDRTLAAQSLAHYDMADETSIVWFSNGLDSAGTADFLTQLGSAGQVDIVEDRTAALPHLLSRVDTNDNELIVAVQRPAAGPAMPVTLIASDENGAELARMDAHFDKGEVKTQLHFDLPVHMRSEIAHIEIEGENSTGSKLLLDDRWRLRTVGVLGMEETDIPRSNLLDGTHFVSQALQSSYPVRSVDPSSPQLDSDLSVLIITDSVDDKLYGPVSLNDWVTEHGGTVIRFAGPNMASRLENGADVSGDVLSVPMLPGAYNIEEGKNHIKDFAPGSPFYGLDVPDDVYVNRLVLPEPSSHIDEQTWARLADDTPFVTASRKGKGLSITFQTTANMDWSNLALSVLYVDMLEAAVNQSKGIESSQLKPGESLPPFAIMDDQGDLQAPEKTVRALVNEDMRTGYAGPDLPPGYYGTSHMRYAHNLADAVAEHEVMPAFDQTDMNISSRRYYEDFKGKAALQGAFLAAAMGLLLADLGVLLGQQGQLPFSRRRSRKGRPSSRPQTPVHKP